MLIVGFGGGVVVEGVPPSVRHVDVIELEPKVIEANRVTGALRKRNPLADPRVNIIVNDARGALRLTDRRYDAIVSQPSHPWTAGASHLYTREFMQLAHDHLNSDGVFVQWMNVIFMDEDLLRSLTATLLSVFGEVRVYRPDPNTVVFLASDAPLDVELQLARSGLPLRDAPLHYARFGINNVEDLLTALVLDSEGARRIAAGAPLITDDDNRIATSSVFEKGRGMTGDTSGRLFAAHDPLQRADSVVYGPLKDALSFPYLARRIGVFVLLDPSLADRVGRMSQIVAGDARGEYLRAYYYRMKNQAQRASETAAARHRRISGRRFACAWNSCAAGTANWRRTRRRRRSWRWPTGSSAPAARVLAAARHAVKNGMARSRHGRRGARRNSLDQRLVFRSAGIARQLAPLGQQTRATASDSATRPFP